MTFQPPVKVFLSYAHDDSYWCVKFYKHLSGLIKDGIIDVWYDAFLQKLEKGDDPWTVWRPKIDEELQKANVFIFLLSSSFGDSEFCDYEFTVAKQRMEGGEHVKLLPVNLKAWEKSHEFRIVQLVPSDRPICSRSNRDDAFAETARLIRRIADTILALRTPITGDLDETSP